MRALLTTGKIGKNSMRYFNLMPLLPLLFTFACSRVNQSYQQAEAPQQLKNTLIPDTVSSSLLLTQDFDLMSEYIKKNWANRSVHENLDHYQLDVRIADFKKELLGAPPVSDQEFYVKLRLFVLRLHDGHFSTQFPNAKWVSESSAMSMQETDEGIFLTACDTECKGLQLPLKVLAINSLPTEEWLTLQADSAPGSTFTGRRYHVLKWLSGYYEGLLGERELPTSITVEDAAGQKIILPYEFKKRTVFPNPDLNHCIWSEAIENTLVLHVATFFCGQAPEEGSVALARFTEQMNSALSNAKMFQAVVVDLRGNGGGLPDEAMALAEHFLVRPSLYYQTLNVTRAGSSLFPMMMKPSSAPYPNEILLQNNPLWLFTNGGCFSQCSIFVKAMRDSGRAKIVGIAMDAGAGGVVPWTVPSGKWKVNIPTWEVLESDHSFLEGSEVIPEISTLPSLKDLNLFPSDPALFNALDKITAVLNLKRETTP